VIFHSGKFFLTIDHPLQQIVAVDFEIGTQEEKNPEYASLFTV